MDKMKLSKEEKERQVIQYLEDYDIENVVSEMLNSLLHEMDKNPYVYMIKYLASLMSEDERKEFDLNIPEPYPQSYPVVHYPKFTELNNSLFKKYFTKEQYSNLKKLKTKFGNNINSISKITELLPEDQIGCIISDSDCVNVYKPIFDPIIEEVHEIKINQLKEYKLNHYSNVLNSDIGLNQLKGYIQKIHLSFSRNIQDYPFNNYSCGNDRIGNVTEFLVNEIENKMQEHIIPKMKKYTYKEDKNIVDKILNDINFDLKWFHNSGLKHSFPEYRVIYSTGDFGVVILLNFSDHFQIIRTLRGDDINIEEEYENICEIIQQLGLTIPFESHKYFGFLTTDINMLGDGFKVTSDIILKNTNKQILEGATFEELINGLKFDRYEIIKEGKNVRLLTSESSKINEKIYSFLILYMNKIAGLSRIFNNNKDGKKLNFIKYKLPNINSPTYKYLKETYEETFDKVKYYISSSGSNINDFIKQIKDGEIIEDIGLLFSDKSEYLAFQEFFYQYLLKSQHFDCKITEHIHEQETQKEMIELSKDELTKVKSVDIIILRNIDGYPFAPSINNENEQTEQILIKTINELNNKKDFGTYYSLTKDKQEAQRIIKENDLKIGHNEKLKKYNLNIDYPKNRGVIVFEQDNIFGLINDISHLKLYLKLKNPEMKLSHEFVQLLKIDNEFVKRIKYHYNSHLGFLTTCIKYVGTGIIANIIMKVNNLSFSNIKDIVKGSDFDVKDEKKEGKSLVFTLYNVITIGQSETSLLTKLLSVMKKIIQDDDY